MELKNNTIDKCVACVVANSFAIPLSALSQKAGDGGIDQTEPFTVDQPRRCCVGAGDDQAKGDADNGKDDSRQMPPIFETAVERQRGG